MSNIIDPPQEVPQPPLTYTSFDVKVDNVILYTSATLRVLLYNSDSLIKVEILQLEGEDYQKWGANDSYIIEYVREKLSLPPYNIKL